MLYLHTSNPAFQCTNCLFPSEASSLLLNLKHCNLGHSSTTLFDDWFSFIFSAVSITLILQLPRCNDLLLNLNTYIFFPPTCKLPSGSHSRHIQLNSLIYFICIHAFWLQKWDSDCNRLACDTWFAFAFVVYAHFLTEHIHIQAEQKNSLPDGQW